MTAGYQQHPSSASPASGWWWLCLLTTLLFVFQVNYSRIHLLTETHHTCGDKGGWTAAVHHDDDAHEHRGENDHQPHSQSEHQLQLAAKQLSSYDDAGYLIPSATHLLLINPERRLVHSPSWQGCQPANPPPDPAQPRAPPTA